MYDLQRFLEPISPKFLNNFCHKFTEGRYFNRSKSVKNHTMRRTYPFFSFSFGFHNKKKKKKKSFRHLVPLICFSEISAEYMGTMTQNMPPQAPVRNLPTTRRANTETPIMMKTQPRMKAGIRESINHFRPILSIRNGTIGNPQAAPNGKIAAIKAIADMSYMCSSFKSSTHGALHPIPQPSENPPMHAAEFIPNNDDMG